MNSFENSVSRKGTDCIKWDFQKEDYGRENLLPFSIADADWKTCPDIIEALKERCEHGIFGYTDISDSYRSAVERWCRVHHDWQIEKEWIVPVEGVVPSIADCIEALSEPGAKVIVQPPVYDPFYAVVRATGRECMENSLIHDEHGYHMNFEELEQMCQNGASVLLLCSPHNPVGRVWNEKELNRVAEICNRDHVTVISDEIHWDLILGRQKHITMGKYAELLNSLVICTSCSKSFNLAGLQTSNLIIPDETARRKVQNFLYGRYRFNPNTFGMIATETAYTKGDEWLAEEIDYIRENAEFVEYFLKGNLPKVTMSKLQGTYLVWLDMRACHRSSEQLVRMFAREGAALNDGSHYGKGYDGFVRMNIACPRSQLEEGLFCIYRALEKAEEMDEQQK